jgi:hypothetical protein
MDAEQMSELATRWVSGDPLTSAEEQTLLHRLQTNPEARQELLEDETLDSLLRCGSRLDDTAEDFVRASLERASRERWVQQQPASVVAAPPVVAPPVATIRPAQPSGDGRPRGRRLLARAVRWMAAVAACSAAVVLGAIGLRALIKAPQGQGFPAQGQVAEQRHDQDAPTKGPEAPPNAPAAPEGAFATLTRCISAEWGKPLAEGDRLAAGVFKLTAGTAELQFDKGSVARITGSAEFELRSVDEVFLRVGSLSAAVPPKAVGFAVATPLSRIVDLGTEFDVDVADSGTTETKVRKGRVSLLPHRGQEDLGKAIELAAGALDTAMLSVPNVVAPLRPVVVIAHGAQGRFLGRVSANGKTAEFKNRVAFREFRAKAVKQLREAPGQFGRNWPALADSAHRQPAAPNLADLGPGTSDTARSPTGNHSSPAPRVVAEGHSVEVEENGKRISITDTKESGITVTITESVSGKERRTKVRAADQTELEKKSPEAQQLYRKYFRQRQKNGKAK